jgi:hypothetical protein
MIMLVPTFPIVFAFIYSVRTDGAGGGTQPRPASAHDGSDQGRGHRSAVHRDLVITTLTLAALMAWFSYRFYRRESIVG